MSVSEPFIRRPIATSLLGIALMIGGALIGYLTGIVASTGPLSVPLFLFYGLDKGAFLATGNACANKVQSTLGHLRFTADRVGVQRITTIDDDVTFVHFLGELGNDGVSTSTRLHHNQRATWALQ